MAIFKDHKVGISDLLQVLPESLLVNLSENTKVDYYAKVLHGKKLFYLLMYGILENDRLSQRTLEDTFNDPVFKMLFNLDASESVRRSSISERLSKIDSDFFKQIYQCIYDQFSEVYTTTERQKYNLIRVDSTIVSEACNKLMDGFSQNQSGKTAVKYSTAFDGILPCLSKVFTTSEYGSEDIALPEVVKAHVKEDVDHSNMYLLDRGLQSTRNMKYFSDKHISFIVRGKENRKYVELESLINQDSDTNLGSLILIKDCIVNLYTGIPMTTQKGTIRYKETLIEEPFRLIIAKRKDEQDKQFWFITNEFDWPAKDITDAYRQRWDIEVFFRFIKQELNVSHLVSLNKNGIEVMLYMSLIVAMLILIYKHANNIGYKTAKRRFTMEMRNLVISMIVIECGGEPSIFFKNQIRKE
jgi:transposase